MAGLCNFSNFSFILNHVSGNYLVLNSHLKGKNSGFEPLSVYGKAIDIFCLQYNTFKQL